MEEMNHKYDFCFGYSTGQFLLNISIGASKNRRKLRQVYTSVNQNDIFSNCPFVIKKKIWNLRGGGGDWNTHINVMKIFLGK